MTRLTPVDHDPFAEAAKQPRLVPIDHDPFAGPTAAETTYDVGMSGTAGINRGIDNFINLPWNVLVRAPARALGYDLPEGRYFSRANADREPETRAGRYAASVGEAVGSNILPSAAVLRAASTLPLAASSAPTLAERFLRPVATAPTAATAIDIAASTGAGLAQEGAREAGGGPIAQTLAGIAGGVAPVMAGVTAARAVPPALEALRQRLGIRLSADGGQSISPSAQAKADQIIADTLTGAGLSADDAWRVLTDAQESRRFWSSGKAQDVLALVDVDDSLRRLVGSQVRQSTEAANTSSTFMRARQTGETPTEQPLHEGAGLPHRPAFARPMTGAQAERQLGSSFDTPARRLVPMGMAERIRDGLRRAYLISDKEYHRHAATGFRTEQEVMNNARRAARTNYDETYRAGNNVNLAPLLQQTIATRRASLGANESSRAAREAERMLRDFETASHIRKFDKTKQYWDDQIDGYFSSTSTPNRYVGRLLTEIKDELLDVVDNVATNNLGPLYREARNQFEAPARIRDALRMGRDSLKENSEVTADNFAALRTDGERKAFRLGQLDGVTDRAKRMRKGEDVTKIFDNQRMQDILAVTIPRTETPTGRVKIVDGRPAEFSDRPERFGRFLEDIRREVRTRNVVGGGSSTARNLADDEALDTLHTLAEQFKQFRDNPSIAQLKALALNQTERVLMRMFGQRADVARELTETLFSADPAVRSATFQRVSRLMGPERMLRFSQAMQDLQQSTASSIAASSGTVSGPAAAAAQLQGAEIERPPGMMRLGGPTEQESAAAEQSGFRQLGQLEQHDFGNMYRTAEGKLVAVNPRTDVVGSDGVVYARDDIPPNAEAAQAAQRPGVFGKALDAIGVPDHSGERARTSWRDALNNTLGGLSLANAVHGGVTAADRLMTETTSSGRPDPLAAEQGMAVAGTMGTVAAPTALAGGVPRNALTMFIGRGGAEELARAGRPTALRAIETAERLESQGVDPRVIRRGVNKLIAREEPRLGGVEHGPDGMWRLEIDDRQARLAPSGPAQSTLGAELSHPDLYAAYPAARDVELIRGRRTSYEPREGLPSRITIDQRGQNRRSQILHEIQHEVQERENFARGAHPRDFGPGGRLEHLRDAREEPLQAYQRMAGEEEAIDVERRAGLSPAQRRATPREARENRYPDDEQIVVRESGTARSVGQGTERLMQDIAKLEREMKAQGASPQSIASEIERRFANRNIGPVSPDDVASGAGWWNVDETMTRERLAGRNRWDGVKLSPEERAILKRGFDNELPLGDIARQITEVSGRPMTAQRVHNAFYKQGMRRNRSGEAGARYSAAEWNELRQGLDEGLSWTVLAERIEAVSGRTTTPEGVRRAASRMRGRRETRAGGVPLDDVDEPREERAKATRGRNALLAFSR